MNGKFLQPIFRFTGCIFFLTFLFSCGSKEGEKGLTSSNDSTPPDVRKINGKIDEDRNNSDLYVDRAKAWFDHKEFDKAIDDMKIALNIDSSKAGYYIFLSDLYFTQNKTRDTRDMLRKAIKLDSTNSQALMKYSELFYLLRKYDTAVFFINRSLHFDRANAVAHFQKGMIMKEARDTMNSIASFQEAVKLNPDYFDAYMQLGVLQSAKKNPLAVEYFNTALKLNPKSIEALYGMGRFLQNAGEYEGALKAYNGLLEISPENQDAVFNIGAIYFEQKKYDEAMQKFEQTIQRDENFHRGYYGRGRCYEALGDKTKAMADYRHCLAIKPDYDLAKFQLELLLKKSK